MKTVYVASDDYSELIVRKSLYWCSPLGNWILRKEQECWEILYSDDASDFEASLYRHLNDFKLREMLDKNTAHLRQQIIVAALNAVLVESAK